MTKMRELKTEIKMPRLTIDPCPRRGPFRRVNGRLVLDALGFYWPLRFLALAACIAAVAAALWAWLGR